MADIRLASSSVRTKNKFQPSVENLVTPGDVITSDTCFMRGHGTYTADDRLHASVAGVVERVNKLICVRPLKTRYNGEVGDVVVGRIIEVGQRRWKVDTHSKLDSVLMLSSVNLPGGELRRRSEEDEKMMRHYLKENDLISAEVHSVFSDGSLSLHTRSLKYGKPVSCGDREVIARMRNCILALSHHKMMLFDTSILYTYDNSLKFSCKDILKPEIMNEVVEMTRLRLEQETL
ncbi:exosome complex component RRP4 isoform X2 [Octopus sinensis]|uniref:Exosome complex component RRP4 n=1 Tax=Octopus sinensis TaxID=2607531 RepID=A0A7E6EN68_9MOLL|nr:exosome complex component RRP4 isoform X2 [Octopus sinensis]